jgi:hypothetical protein
MTYCKTKTFHPKWDGRRFTLPAVPPKLTVLHSRTIHFVPTNIGLSSNVEITAQTTKRGIQNTTRSSPLRLKRELQLGLVERGFQPVPHASLTTSTSLLSSVIAFYWGRLLRFIICENKRLSRLNLFIRWLMVPQLLPSRLYPAPEAR